jgi:hypothetical protein
MTDADDIKSLQEQLAAHRATLAVLLRQRADLGADHAPPGVHNGITQARAEIARLKAALRDAGVAVEDQAGDVATLDEVAGPVGAPARGVRQTIEGGDHNIQAVDSTVTATSIGRDQLNAQGSQGFVNRPTGPVSQHFGDQTTINSDGGDVAQGNLDKRQGTFIAGNVYNYPQPRLAIDPTQAQQLLDRLPLDAIPDPAPLPPGSRMPLSRNPFFVGRAEELSTLAATLKGGMTAAIGQITAATGLGGIGKTQLAVEFAHRYGQFFLGGVFWLSFADASGVPTEIATCGAVLDLPGFGGMKLDEQVARVRQAWQRPIPCLLIFDNCEDEALLDAWRPTSGYSRVLVTSRRGQWRKNLGVVALPLGVLSRVESIALLQRYRDDINEAEADLIAAELGDLPLALSLAGSYLDIYRDETFGAPNAYLANLRRQLLGHRSLSAQEHSVLATFELSYQQLNIADPVDALAITALARTAHLVPGESFPRTLLLATFGEVTDHEEIAVQRADAIRRLVVLGLIEVAQDGVLRIHRLIAAFVRAAIEDDTALAAVEGALIDRAYQINTAGYPTAMQPILAHLRYRTEAAAKRADALAAMLCNRMGYYLDAGGELRFERFWPHKRRVSVLRKALQLHCAPPKSANTRVAPHGA